MKIIEMEKIDWNQVHRHMVMHDRGHAPHVFILYYFAFFNAK